MANPKPSDVLGRVTLVTGPEEFLRERTVVAIRTAVRSHDSEAEVSETTGDQVSAGQLEELSAPSLFSTTRFALVRNLEDTPEDSFAPLLEFAEAAPEDVALVLVHSGGQKGSGLLTKLRKVSSVTEVKVAALKGKDYVDFVGTEVSRLDGRIDKEAAELLVSALGQDLRALAGAASQLAGDFPGERLTEPLVAKYFSGRADVKGFVIADHALYGRTAAALEELRWAVDSGVGAPAITGSFASTVRGLARFKAASGRGRMSESDLAREAGVPPWKVRILREQARGWDERGLAHAVRAVARADSEVKGAGSDAAYSLERMVLTICEARVGR